MAEFKIIQGDATDPVGTDNKLLIHCCNNIGKWGAGFVLALSKKWPEPEGKYRMWNLNGEKYYPLGDIQPVTVRKDLVVVNMIAQHGIGRNNYGHPPVRYYALDICLEKVCKLAQTHNASVHLPYLMCCALAGGEWRYVEVMLLNRLVDQGVNVTAYKFSS